MLLLKGVVVLIKDYVLCLMGLWGIMGFFNKVFAGFSTDQYNIYGLLFCSGLHCGTFLSKWSGPPLIT